MITDWVLERLNEFSPGKAFQFDWSKDRALISGERPRLQVARFKLNHSKAFFLRVYLLSTHEMPFNGKRLRPGRNPCTDAGTFPTRETVPAYPCINASNNGMAALAIRSMLRSRNCARSTGAASASPAQRSNAADARGVSNKPCR